MDWAPATTEAEIAQNVRSLLATPQGTQPLARALGCPVSALDAPIAASQARIASNLNGQIRLYEPRAEVKRISVALSIDGAVEAEVVLR